MPYFEYRAVDQQNEAISGTMDAKDRQALSAALQRQGLFLVWWTELKSTAPNKGGIRLSLCRWEACLKAIAEKSLAISAPLDEEDCP